jgi:DNA polymerase (family 10)
MPQAYPEYSFKLKKESEERILLIRALEISSDITEELKKIPEVKKLEVAGSIRRRKETIGDIDILITCDPKKRKKIIDRFVSIKRCKIVLAKGETKSSIIISYFERQVDLRIVNENEWGAALLYLTGSKEHNISLRTIAKEKGLKINEYGVFNIKNNKHVAGRTEEEIYKILGFTWVPPELRESKEVLVPASKNKIPKLITSKDIKGDMQMHSNWSDGNLKIEDLARFVRKNFKYEYIVLTDHSKSERIAGGMTEKKFLQQLAEIKKINLKNSNDFIKCGAEVDILPDGSLDLKDSLLAKLDWVCASIHSGFSKDNTARLIKACMKPCVNCIGHPSGRLIGKREG